MTEPSGHGSAADVLSSHPAGRPPRRLPGWLAVVLAAAALVGLARLTSTEPAKESAAPPVSAPTSPVPNASHAPPVPISDLGSPLSAVTGQPADIGLGRDGLYVLQSAPGELLRLSLGGRRLAMRPVPRGAIRLAVDRGRGLVWVWTNARPFTVVRAYDARTLAGVATTRLDEQVLDGVAYGGALWLGATVDVVRIVPGAAPVRVVSANFVFAVAADHKRHRVLAELGDAVAAYDARSLRLVARRPLTVGKPSLAVVGNDVWIGGFTDAGRRVFHFAGPALGPTPQRTVDRVVVGPGAMVWPGARVLWVRDGGSEDLTCVDPTTGVPLTTWSGVLGPVVSRRHAAFAVTESAVVPLLLGNRCAG